METLGGFLARNPSAKQNWAARSPKIAPLWIEAFFKKHADKPYSFERKVFPKWYLTRTQYKALFGHDPQKEASAFAYDRRSHNLMALYDCKQEIAALIEGIDVR